MEVGRLSTAELCLQSFLFFILEFCFLSQTGLELSILLTEGLVFKACAFRLDSCLLSSPVAKPVDNRGPFLWDPGPRAHCLPEVLKCVVLRFLRERQTS